MKKLRTIIIDDEPDSSNLLKFELSKHCPTVEVIAVFNSSAKALPEIEMLQPDLLFLDIEMPYINGFELLEKLLPVNFKVIFVTAYNQFAIKAFKFNALDYLLKPFDVTDLVNAVAKAAITPPISLPQMDILQKEFKANTISKIGIPSQHGISFIKINDIEYAEASNNYTKIILQNKQQHIITRTLKDVQEVLEEHQFLRIHRQFIVNLNLVKQFFRGDDMYVVMECGKNIPIARSQKDKLIDRFGWL